MIIPISVSRAQLINQSVLNYARDQHKWWNMKHSPPRVPPSLPEEKPVRVLAIDGGGTKGIVFPGRFEGYGGFLDLLYCMDLFKGVQI